MPKKICILGATFLFLIFNINAQNDLNYYKSILDTIQNPSEKLNVLDSIVEKTKGKDHESFANYAEEFVILATTLKEYDRAAKKAIRSFYYINSILNNPDRALNLIESLLPFEDKLTTSRLKGGLYLKRADGYANGKDLDVALNNFEWH